MTGDRPVPPRLARFLLRLTPLAIHHPEITDELRELYEARVVQYGARDAGRRYLRDVLSLWLHRRPSASWSTRMERLILDLRYAGRRMRATPLSTAIALLTIALGVGANTAIFSVADGALFRPAPFPQADRIVNIYEVDPRAPDRRYSLAFPMLSAWRERRDLVDAVATWKNGRAVVLEREPEQVSVDLVSTDLFAVYGMQPMLGRAFTDADMAPGADPVVILGHQFWQKYFSGDRAVLGRPLHLAGSAPIVIGVLPAQINFTTPLYRPLQLGPEAASPKARQFSVIARLKPGIALEQARRDFEAIAHLQEGATADRAGFAIAVEPYTERVARYARPTVRILFTAVAFVLLIACVNVAGLLFARGATRGRELALRSSLGAGRGRLVAQLLVESCALSLAGSALGIGLAWLGLDALVKAIPLSLPATARPQIDVRVLGFTLLLSMLTGLLFGVPPAWRFSRTNLVTSLAAGARTATPMSRRLSGLLVAVEIALTLMLVSCATLMLRSLVNLYGVDKGFSPAGVITLEATPLQNDDQTFTQYYSALLDRVRALPGVEAAGAADTFPLGPSRAMTLASVVGDTTQRPRGIVVTAVTPGFFDALRIPARAGRLLDAQDRRGAPAAAVVNESAARAFFHGAVPVGREMSLGKDLVQIVGVVADLRSKDLAAEPEPEIYRAYAQGRPATNMQGRAVGRELAIIVRTAADTRTVAAALREQAHAAGPRAIVQRVRTFDDWIADSARLTRQRTTLLTLLGSLGLLLALIGVFGTTSYAVSQRTREIGVRMALGATRGDILQAVGTGAGLAIALGAIAGLAGSVWASRAIAGFLYAVKPLDPVSLSGAVLLLVITAALAAYLPARRALRVDPVNVLREE